MAKKRYAVGFDCTIEIPASTVECWSEDVIAVQIENAIEYILVNYTEGSEHDDCVILGVNGVQVEDVT